MPELLRVLIVAGLETSPLRVAGSTILQALRQAGYDPVMRAAATESEFLASLVPSIEGSVPDVILCDYCLPDLTALEALQLLGQRGLDIPLIIVAEGIGEEQAVEAIKQGAADYSRSDHLECLGGKIQRALAEKKIREDKRRADARLRRAGLHDQLTGLYNRTYFDEELVRLGRTRTGTVSVMVADVDTLKSVNDRQGHAAGDEVLLNTALLLGSVLRRDDIVARIGGDEFCALLPGAAAPAANEAAERVRRALREYNRRHRARSLSLSLGIATGDCKSIRETLAQADAKMYAEKATHVESGRRKEESVKQ